MKWIRLFTEASKTPSDMESINASFNKDVSDKKFTPTMEFIRVVYKKLNKLFFDNSLPPTSEFKIEVVSSNKFNGSTKAHDDKSIGNTVIDALQLNGTNTLTMHTWMETILHEMIHIDDLVNHPEHFHRRGYKRHGKWFKEQIEKFKKEGFNVTVKYSGNFGTNTDDDLYIKNKNAIFIKISENPLGPSDMIKVQSSDRQWALECLYVHGYRKVKILHTDNENAGRLDYSEYDGDSGFNTYHLTDKFVELFGPFDEVENIDLTKIIAESGNDFLPDDIIEVDEPDYKQYIRNGVRYYEIS